MRKPVKRLSALLLAGCLLSSALPAAAAGEKADLTIASAGDFLAFAEACSLDAWSQGKTVRLTADLDLTGTDFTPVPTFGGTFLGGGHRITGLRITASGSNTGLFRYLQESAVVQDLNVTGVIRPGGSAVNVGGLVGDNAGALRNCRFQGIVEGVSAVGGIAGLNRESGEIAGTVTCGSVSGESFTGGVTGRNLGSLLHCENQASINTATPSQEPVRADGLTLPLDAAEARSEEDVGFLKSHSDTGGIAGFSSGILYSCLNTGAVGYPHVGYNIGGIAGRQCGHLSGCTNRGTVLGRKDVGGIVGQAEPDVALSPDSGTLDRLRQELNTLDHLISGAITQAEHNGDGLSQRLTSMGLTAGAARNHTEDLMSHLTDFTDENIDSLNSLSASVTKALDGLTPALEELSGVSERAETLSRRLEEALGALGDAASQGSGVSGDASLAAGLFRQAGETLSAAVRDLQTAVNALRSAVVIQDQDAVDAALADLSGALEDFGSALDQAGQAADALREALTGIPSAGDARAALELLSKALKDLGSSLRQAGGALNTLHSNTSLDWAQVRASLREAGVGFQGLGDAAGRLNQAIRALQTALDSLGALSGELGDALRMLGDAAAVGVPIGQGLERAFALLRSVTQDLADAGPTQFTPLGDPVREAGRGIFDSLAGLGQELEDLHNAMDRSGSQLSASLQAINRQFHTVSSVLLDALEDARDGGDSRRELVEDTSEENIAATRYGKVENCRNEGTADGDRNVGGIAGAMALEFGLDPEDDASSRFSFGSTYETKAVLEDCLNQGRITAKKDCAGGIVGRMDMGTAWNCQGFGPVSSTSGDYVGGVAGWSGSSIRSCYGKAALSGGNYVGGIAGWGSRLQDCFAIVTIEAGTECLGAIAGGADSSGLLSGNRFLNTGTAGVDGVSYAGQAEPISFEELRQLPDLPAAFTAFTLTLLAGEETVAQIPFAYGDGLTRLDLPAVPAQEGYYGFWPEPPAVPKADVTLEAVYEPWVTLAASEELDESGKRSLALAEGQFTQDAVLRVRDSAQTPPQAGTGIRVWDVSLSGTELTSQDTVPLRLLGPAGGAAVWQYRDGQWRETEAVRNGQYLLLSMEGTEGTFCILPQTENRWLLPAAGGGVLLAAAILAAKKHRNKRKTAA